MSSSSISMNIGARIKAVRSDFSLTQSDFASSLGISQNYLSEIEKGIKTPSETILIALSCIYKINIKWLRLGKGTMSEADK